MDLGGARPSVQDGGIELRLVSIVISGHVLYERCQGFCIQTPSGHLLVSCEYGRLNVTRPNFDDQSSAPDRLPAWYVFAGDEDQPARRSCVAQFRIRSQP